jgi:hypothetical protein
VNGVKTGGGTAESGDTATPAAKAKARAVRSISAGSRFAKLLHVMRRDRVMRLKVNCVAD